MSAVQHAMLLSLQRENSGDSKGGELSGGSQATRRLRGARAVKNGCRRCTQVAHQAVVRGDWRGGRRPVGVDLQEVTVARGSRTDEVVSELRVAGLVSWS